ncbi:MAG TPA: fatty acid desaturase, partial [Myxococcales bacterium]|nr:fatty acid desaturase [Myxococcales bacterium]
MSHGHEDDARWQDVIRPYCNSQLGKSIWQLVNTLIPYTIVWYSAYRAFEAGYYGLLACLCVMGGMLTARLFIINHDCGHGSFFKSTRANDIVGFFTGMLSYTPYWQWRYNHALHHATFGQVEQRGIGYFWTMTVKEYWEQTPTKRLIYRIYRHPLITYPIGGVWLFVIEYRFAMKGADARMKRQVWAVNIAWAILIGVISYFTGQGDMLRGLMIFACIQIPMSFVS